MSEVLFGTRLQIGWHGELADGAVAVDFDRDALHALEHRAEFDKGLRAGVGVPEFTRELDRVCHRAGLALGHNGVALAYPAFRPQHPLSAALFATRVNTQHAAIGFIDGLDHEIALLANEHGFVNFYAFKFDGAFAVHFHAGSEHDFEIAGGWEQAFLAQAVIGDELECAQVDDRAPRCCGPKQTAAEQRVARLFEQIEFSFLGQLRIAGVVPRVARQLDVGARAGRNRIPVDVDATHIKFAERCGHCRFIAEFAVERYDDGRIGAGCAGALRRRAGERAVGCQFEENVSAKGRRSADGVRITDRLAQIVPPIVGIEAALGPACDR